MCSLMPMFITCLRYQYHAWHQMTFVTVGCKLLPTQAHICVCRRSLACYTRRYFCESFVVHRASLQCNINNCLL